MLFVSPEPLSLTRLVARVGRCHEGRNRTGACRGSAEDLEQEGRGVRLAEIAGGYRLVTKQEYAPG